jgi:hypothetical protein
MHEREELEQRLVEETDVERVERVESSKSEKTESERNPCLGDERKNSDDPYLRDEHNKHSESLAAFITSRPRFIANSRNSSSNHTHDHEITHNDSHLVSSSSINPHIRAGFITSASSSPGSNFRANSSTTSACGVVASGILFADKNGGSGCWEAAIRSNQVHQQEPGAVGKRGGRCDGRDGGGERYGGTGGELGGGGSAGTGGPGGRDSNPKGGSGGGESDATGGEIGECESDPTSRRRELMLRMEGIKRERSQQLSQLEMRQDQFRREYGVSFAEVGGSSRYRAKSNLTEIDTDFGGRIEATGRGCHSTIMTPMGTGKFADASGMNTDGISVPASVKGAKRAFWVREDSVRGVSGSKLLGSNLLRSASTGTTGESPQTSPQIRDRVPTIMIADNHSENESNNQNNNADNNNANNSNLNEGVDPLKETSLPAFLASSNVLDLITLEAILLDRVVVDSLGWLLIVLL